MAIDQATKKAIALGRQQAKEVLEFRNKALKGAEERTKKADQATRRGGRD
ncbi:MAG: hypothetical protein ACREYF_21195 [Gammaproteobacteria bacterium]